jgi:hypothetical protein
MIITVHFAGEVTQCDESLKEFAESGVGMLPVGCWCDYGFPNPISKAFGADFI